MEWRKRLQNPFVQQYLVEILFPLIGYFFFDWGLLTIGIYYFLDYFSGQLLFYRRVWKIKYPQTSVSKKQKVDGVFIASIIAFLLLFAALFYGFLWLISVLENKTYAALGNLLKDFALDEGWLLLPVLILMYYMKDQFTFYMPRKYMIYDYKAVVFTDFLMHLAIALLLVLGGVFWYFVKPQAYIVILSFLVIKIGFDFTLKRYLDRKSLKKGA